MTQPAILAVAGVPSLIWAIPFALLLLCIAVLPLLKSTAEWWHHNSSKLMVATAAGGVVIVHFATRGFGAHLHDSFVVSIARAMQFPLLPDESGYSTASGWQAAVGGGLNALWEYTPFMVMLFSLYSISGGIVVRGRLPSTPLANTALLAVGGVLSSLVGTTGASVLLIRPLVNALSARTSRVHTVVFFIFIVANVGGTMLPIGDPPLFLGFLRGVPFLWTLTLWKPWALTMGLLLAVYFIIDTVHFRRERHTLEGWANNISLAGTINFLWLVLAVLAVALLAPGAKFPGTTWIVPPLVREGAMLAMVGMSFLTTPGALRRENNFDFFPIAEVACLFIGIFVTLQVPLEILSAHGGRLGITAEWHYFWATGLLSSLLDNAPTYAVFFQTALSTPNDAGAAMVSLSGGEAIRADLLTAISLGAVFMGAMTYIGNGPNFMVKAIAEEAGIKMPGFFGFLGYSCCVLLPVFGVVTVLFML